MAAPIGPSGLTCQTINDWFERETGRIGPDIYRLGLYKSPWTQLMPQGSFPSHMGATVKNAIATRNIPAETVDWTPVGTSNGSSINSCAPPSEVLGFSVVHKEYSLDQMAINSIPFCLNDLRTSLRPAQDMGMFLKQFKDWVNYRWIRRFQDEYFRLADHKVIVNPELDEDSTDWPSVQPTSQLTLGVLKNASEFLYQENAGDPNNGGDAVAADGRPLFTVVLSRTQLDNIIKLNDEIRQDFRWSDRVNELLGPTGFKPGFVYGDFIFMTDPFPPRFNDDGNGGFVRVEPYITAAATLGTQAIVNPAYRSAKYEATYVFHPRVMKNLAPEPSVSVGNGVKYGPQNYRGDITWINKYDPTCNIDEDTGFFRARLMTASEPIYTQWGYVFLHLRCSVANDLAGCVPGTGYPYGGLG